MATPNYKGNGQPVTAGGLFSGLGSLFGGSTPAYAGGGQPSQGVSVIGSATPAYKPAPSSTDASPSICDDGNSEQITVVIPRELLTPQT
jgi:hypothetical protein